MQKLLLISVIDQSATVVIKNPLKIADEHKHIEPGSVFDSVVCINTIVKHRETLSEPDLILLLYKWSSFAHRLNLHFVYTQNNFFLFKILFIIVMVK